MVLENFTYVNWKLLSQIFSRLFYAFLFQAVPFLNVPVPPLVPFLVSPVPGAPVPVVLFLAVHVPGAPVLAVPFLNVPFQDVPVQVFLAVP